MEALSAHSLPPGFGFHPTDVELISHYLKRKVLGMKIDHNVIPEIDIYKHEPWDLPAKCNVPTRDSKWHFFASRDKKYPNGSRSNRTTGAGYWKSTGKDRNIRCQNRAIGTKKTLVFHEGRPPSGKRTEWIMHEYYINENECKAAPGMKDAFVLCRVTKRNGWGLDGGENVSPVSPVSENAHDSAREPEGLALPVVPENSSGPSESTEDLDAWLSELFDPNPYLGEVKTEPEEALSSLGLNPEPLNSYHLHELSDDSHVLFPVEEFCDILQSDAQSYDVFGDLDIGDMASFGNQQEDIFAGLTNDEDNAWSGIRVREREPNPRPGTLNQRIRLQVRKMESRNGESLSGTIRVDQSVHLYQDQAAAEPKPSAGATRKDQNARKGPGLVRGLRDSFARCSSASMNCFFLLVCGMGTAALIMSFMLRDARRFVGSFSAL